MACTYFRVLFLACDGRRRGDPNEVNSNGGSAIPISDWLSPKNQRGILNLSRKSGVIVINRGVFLQNRDFGSYLESRSGNRE